MANYLITGVNKGIGLGLLDLLSQDKANTVIGTVRSLDKAQHVLDWKRSNVHLIVLDISQDIEEFDKAFKQLDSIVPSGLDVVINSGGIMGPDTIVSIADYKAKDYLEVFDVNVIGAVKLYQSVSPYLYKGEGTKKYVFISSMAGQIVNPMFLTHGYGVSKVAMNFFMKQINVENSQSEDPLKKNAVVYSVHPGVVETDMAKDILEKAKGALAQIQVIQPKESAEKIIGTLATAKTGTFVNNDGTVLEL